MWGIYQIGTTIHVIPVDEEAEHSRDSVCRCKPRVIIENGSNIIVHDAFDGRVAVEMANEILNEGK